MRNIRRQLGWWMLLSVVLTGTAVAQGEESVADRAASMLYLNDGDYFSGSLSDCPTPNVVRWQSPGATRPFEFNADAVRSAYFTPPPKRPAPDGEYCIELSDGDVLYGSLAAITKDQLEVNSAQFGHLKITRGEVRRLTPAASAAFVYRGPNGLSEWSSMSKSKWRDEAGRLITNERGASIKKEIEIPDQAHLEFEISWSKSPQFMLGFYSSDAQEEFKEGFRLEVWGRKLVLVRELEHDADVALVTEIDAHADRVHLEALYNRSTGEFLVQALDGKQLAKIVMPVDGEKPVHIVRFMNLGADLCVEQLTVGHWNGRLPPQVDVDKPRVHKNDGTIVYGDVVGYQADTKQFVVQSAGAESRVDSSQVACIVQTPTGKSVPSTFRVGLHDGSRFSGDLAKVAGDKLYLQRRGIDQPLAFAVTNIRSLVGLSHDIRSRDLGGNRFGRWESAGLLSHGSLVEAKSNPDPQSTCLIWRPRFSNTSSALRSDVVGRIVYRDPPPPPMESEQDENMRGRRQPQRQAGFFWGAVNRALGSGVPLRQPLMATGAGTLCLLTGDRIPCEAMQIDEEGIHFTSSVVASNFVPHRAAKALEFVPKWTAAALAEVKRTRLLTLPRMQKGNPPTHLVVSTAGDFLRCRLISMNADSLVVEARLETQKVARGRVACIIWLHDLDGTKPASPPANPPPAGLLVQAVQSDGIRLTFVPQECDGTTLAGASDVLGACRVRLNAVDQLILGSMIKQAAEEQMYGAWKLRDAVEPEFAREGADGGKADRPGADSILVGKPAPDFQLDLLNGGRFKLSEQKGKVVVLEFWASWCGPCMQAMPETEKVTEEFKDRGVKFIAVNMQEDQASVSSALERLKIHPLVVLDIDGAAAERYQVSAIPQIVVIDAENKVAELLIGGNSGFADQLRDAIQKTLTPKKAN